MPPELIEFADLIPPLQAELQGTLWALYLHRCHLPTTHSIEFMFQSIVS
jgi:hypothetical protein